MAVSRRSIDHKTLREPDSLRRFPHGAGSVVRVGKVDVGRAVLEPGWRWSNDIKPGVGTDWCEAHHLHVVLAGRFGVQLEGGAQFEFTVDDVIDLPPGHDAWVIGDEPVVLLDISGNVSDFGLAAPRTRSVATMLMSDIVGSTDTAETIGDVGWKRLLTDHDRIVRRNLERFHGREVKTTGDGFLATFSSAGAALLCAVAMRDELAQTATPVRVGVHAGEVEVLDDDIRGIAVHAAARIMSAAGTSEVLTSPVTRVLAEGTPVHFASRGAHSLKGLDSPMELFAVER